jgi:hypothetical protein
MSHHTAYIVMLSVVNKPIMLSVIMLNVVMLIDMAPFVDTFLLLLVTQKTKDSLIFSFLIEEISHSLPGTQY